METGGVTTWWPKKIRRNAKAALTRPTLEVSEALHNVEKAYNDLVIKHEEYTTLIDDDTDFDEAERWMEDCQGSFMTYLMRGKEYLEKLVSQEKVTLENGADKGKEKTANNQTGISIMQTGQGGQGGYILNFVDYVSEHWM